MDKKTNLTICCPSRGRPKFAQRMALTALETADNPDLIDIKFYLNTDDPTLSEYKHLLQKYDIGPDQSTVYSWNSIAETNNSYLYMLAGDDIQFLTHGWDSKFMNCFTSYPDGIFMISFDNGIDKLRTSPHPVVTEQWRQALGWYFPFMFHHWHVDTYTRDLAQAIDRYVFFEDITIKAKKITKDSTAKKIRTNGIPMRDHFVYDKMKECYFGHDVDKLRKAII